MGKYDHLFNTQPNVSFNRIQDRIETDTNVMPGSDFRNHSPLELSNATQGDKSKNIKNELRNSRMLHDFKNKAIYAPSIMIQTHSNINSFNPI